MAYFEDRLIIVNSLVFKYITLQVNIMSIMNKYK